MVFEAERLLYVLGVFKLHKYLIIISIPKNSLLNKFIISFLHCLQVDLQANSYYQQN